MFEMKGGLDVKSLLCKSSDFDHRAHFDTKVTKKPKKRRRAWLYDNSTPFFVVEEQRGRLPPTIPELVNYPIKIARALNIFSQNDKIYRAMEAVGGNAILVAPASTSATLYDMSVTLQSPQPLTLGKSYKCQNADSFVGRILAFNATGDVAVATSPVVAELLCASRHTNIFVISACEPCDPHATAHDALVDRFCRIALRLDDDLNSV